MSNNRELIWVDKEIARKYKELESDTEKLKLVNEVIKNKGLDITADIENLNDDLLRFKAFALNYSTEFEKTYKEQTDKMEKFHETNGYIFDKISTQTRKLQNEVSKISDEIKELNNQMDKIETYKIERMIGLIEKFNGMSSEDKRIFELIMKSQG